MQPVFDPNDPRLPALAYERAALESKYRRAEMIVKFETATARRATSATSPRSGNPHWYVACVGQDFGYQIQTFTGWDGGILPAVLAPSINVHMPISGQPQQIFAAPAAAAATVPTPAIGSVSASSSASLNVLYGQQMSAKIHSQQTPNAPVRPPSPAGTGADMRRAQHTLDEF